MKSIIVTCMIVLAQCGVLAAQNPRGPVVQQQGIQVELPVSSQAVAMPDADRADASVITVSARGDLYIGTQPITVGEISGLRASTVYVKADAQAPYEQVLSVLSALGGHKVVLLTEATVKAAPDKITPPYGISLTVAAQ